MIALENSSVRFSTQEGSDGCCFEIFTRYRTYFFRASSEVEASEWIEAVNHARDFTEDRGSV